MEYLRKKYICKNQIKKGRSSIRELIKLFNDGTSIALMIDQRVSEGIKSNFFNKQAYTTTIPGQFVKKFNCRVVPIYIDRIDDLKFKLNAEKIPSVIITSWNKAAIAPTLNCHSKRIQI